MFFRHALSACSAAVAIGLAFGPTAFGQEEATPKYEIGLEYSGLHVNAESGNYHRNGNGGAGYFEYNLNRTFGLVADLGGYANTKSGLDDRLLTYLFGPRVNFRHSRLTPYGQFLIGGAYLWNGPSYGNTQNAFAFATGGGLDYRLTDHIAIKPIQVEYLRTSINSTSGFGDHQNGVRYSAGIVFRLGSK